MMPAPALILSGIPEADMDAAVVAAAASPRGTVCIGQDGSLVADGRYVVLATTTRVVSWPRFETTVTNQDVVTVHVVRPLD